MKKVKVMLVSISILAVIGGMFAFKAKQAYLFNGFVGNYNLTLKEGYCTIPATTTLPPNPGVTSYFTITNRSTWCTSKSFITVGEQE